MQERIPATLRGKEILVTIAVIAAIFFIDVSIPPGVFAGELYVVAILVAYRLHDTRNTLVTAMVCSILVVVGYYASGEGAEFQMGIINHLPAILTIWVTAWFPVASEKAWQGFRISELRARVIVDTDEAYGSLIRAAT